MGADRTRVCRAHLDACQAADGVEPSREALVLPIYPRCLVRKCRTPSRDSRVLRKANVTFTQPLFASLRGVEPTVSELRVRYPGQLDDRDMEPQLGFEPRTFRLRCGCTAVVLLGQRAPRLESNQRSPLSRRPRDRPSGANQLLLSRAQQVGRGSNPHSRYWKPASYH